MNGRKKVNSLMLLLGVPMAAALVLPGCVDNGGKRELTDTRVQVITDKERGVVCYRSSTGRGVAISCLYDPLNPITVEQK